MNQMTDEQNLIRAVSDVLNIHPEPISDETATIELTMGELFKVIQAFGAIRPIKSFQEARRESTCQKRSVVVEIYDMYNNLLARESNRCNPTGGVCFRFEVSNTKESYPKDSNCNWTHAEIQAIAALPTYCKPYRAVLYGHTFYCDACEKALRDKGVEMFEISEISEMPDDDQYSRGPNKPECALCHGSGVYVYGGSFGGPTHSQVCNCQIFKP